MAKFSSGIYAGMGLILFFIFSFGMSKLNTQIGEEDFFYNSTDTYKHYEALNDSVNAIQPETLERVKMLTGAFVSKGYDVASVTKGA
jgi:hypothetical protein